MIGLHTRTHARSHTHTHTHMHAYTHPHLHTHAHINPHTHTHTHTPRACRVVSESPHVERLIHFSELGAEESHASKRLASKAKGDRLLSELVPSATIVRCVECACVGEGC